tara:strand:- start:142 stop:486 length:345 start_codon:yes stop_codon:yes gene_type:complete
VFLPKVNSRESKAQNSQRFSHQEDTNNEGLLNQECESRFLHQQRRPWQLSGARTLSRGIQRQRTERLVKEDDSKDDIESKSKEMTAYLARSTAINCMKDGEDREHLSNKLLGGY